MILPAINQLLIIQERDQKLRQLKTELKNTPIELKSLEARLSHTSAALDAARLKAKEIEIKRKELENTVASINERILKYENQKLSTKKNDEYQAYEHQIETLNKEIAELEDQELALMEQAELQKPIIADAEKKATEMKIMVQRQITELEAKAQNLKARQIEITENREKLAANVDEDLLDTYQRLFEKKDGIAVAALVDETCQGCHVKAQTHIIHAVKAAKEITQCLNCARILYRES